MKEIISLVAVYCGVVLMFVASLGLFRLPDVYTRMSAVTKAVTFKIGLIMLGVCVYFNTMPVLLKAVLVVVFLLITTPVSSHLLGREAYLHKVPFWKKILADELKNEELGEQQSPGSQKKGAGSGREDGPSDQQP